MKWKIYEQAVFHHGGTEKRSNHLEHTSTQRKKEEPALITDMKNKNLCELCVPCGNTLIHCIRLKCYLFSLFFSSIIREDSLVRIVKRVLVRRHKLHPGHLLCQHTTIVDDMLAGNV